MKALPLSKFFLLPLASLVAVLLFSGFRGNNPAVRQAAPQRPVLYVSAPVYDPLAFLSGKDRFPQGAQIFLYEHAAGKPQQLVTGFFAAADPDLSLDAQSLLFAGKKNATDPWQIYEMNLTSREVRAVFPLPEDEKPADLVRPLYLPYGRLVYSRRTAQGFALQSAQLNGSSITTLSAVPGNLLPLDVLVDGRILFESNYPLGTDGPAELYLVYSDGSGVESYRCDHPGKRGAPEAEKDASLPSGRWGGHQLADGDILFTHGESLARFSSPYATEKAVPSSHFNYSDAPVELTDGLWLASAKTTADSKDALFELHGLTARKLLADAANNLVQPVVLAPRTATPHSHPSGLHTAWQYGNFLALDVRATRDAPLDGEPALVKMETIDPAGKVLDLGSAPIEADGSFFVQTTGNRPVRFIVEDKKGRVLRAERGWMWIAKGEQRICVGCHSGPERSSTNKVPAVLLRTTTPTDLNFKAAPQNSTGTGEN